VAERLRIAGFVFADVAQQAEQLFRKQQVAGSSPAIGSPNILISACRC
jgi:hypothetical protein